MQSKVGDSFVTKAFGPGGVKTIKIVGTKTQGGEEVKTPKGSDVITISDGTWRGTTPRASLEQLYSDTTGDYSYLKIFGKSDRPEINQIIDGDAVFLGKGADGVVHDLGDGRVVKSSTTTTYNGVTGEHGTPEQGFRVFANKVKNQIAMREAGAIGVLVTDNVRFGDKLFSIREKLQIPKKFTASQAEEIRASVQSIHDAGYTINDEIQVGLGKDGRVYHFDLGQSSKGTTPEKRRADFQAVRRLIND